MRSPPRSLVAALAAAALTFISPLPADETRSADAKPGRQTDEKSADKKQDAEKKSADKKQDTEKKSEDKKQDADKPAKDDKYVGSQPVIKLAKLPPQPKFPKSIYDFHANDIDGKAVALSKFRNQVLLVVNVASR